MINIAGATEGEVASRPPSAITTWLAGTDQIRFTFFVSVCAFGLYTCIYAFRKTFAAATFADEHIWGMDLKVWLVIAQVSGYAMSKFAGIRIVSEMQRPQRARSIFIISVTALTGWLLFAIVPAPYSFLFMFLNGLVLGLAWGIIFSYLEGRQVTEVLGAALSVSFIFSSGLCRSVGSYVMIAYGVAEKWMPFVAGCLFMLPLLLFLKLLDQTPAPTLKDEDLRSKRQPMDGQARRAFIRTFLPGIVIFVLGYMLLTAFRDFRDNFSAEVWTDLGVSGSPEIYTQTEIPVSIGVLVIMGSTMFIRNNHVALMLNHVIIAGGMILVGLSTWMFEMRYIDPVTWMTIVGLGLYLGYVPFNSVFFERMIAAFRYAGTVGFIMYVADAFGYLGSIAVLLFKQFGTGASSWLDFFLHSAYILSIMGALLILGSMLYFHGKRRQQLRAHAALSSHKAGVEGSLR